MYSCLRRQLLFNEDGSEYNQTLILNDDFTLNEEKLAVVGLPWFATSQVIAAIGTSLSFGATGECSSGGFVEISLKANSDPYGTVEWKASVGYNLHQPGR